MTLVTPLGSGARGRCKQVCYHGSEVRVVIRNVELHGNLKFVVWEAALNQREKTEEEEEVVLVVIKPC